MTESERDFCYKLEVNFPKIPFDYEEFTITEKESGHVGILQNFANAILFDEKLISPGKDGICELAISNAAYMSEWTANAEIALPFDEDAFDSMLNACCTNCKETRKHIIKSQQVEDNQARWQVRW